MSPYPIIIAAATAENRLVLNFVNQVCDTSTAKKPTYGKVMVRVGPKGLPGDIRVVSISELACRSNRPESETIQEVRKWGYLLFSQEAFSRLIDKLVIGCAGRAVALPIPIAMLTAVETLRLETRKAEWVRRP